MPFRKKKDAARIIMIDELVVSEELGSSFFACDIAACKGACCVEGDLGAPLDEDELEILDSIYEAVEPYLRPAGKQAIAEQGKYVYDITQEYSTPLIEGKECAYVTFNDQGLALCGIEQAWQDGKIDFQKPVSCHLYPVRVSTKNNLSILNYDRWDICGAACNKGLHSGVRVYEFVKTALIRKFGSEFYQQLDTIIQQQIAEGEAEQE